MRQVGNKERAGAGVSGPGKVGSLDGATPQPEQEGAMAGAFPLPGDSCGAGRALASCPQHHHRGSVGGKERQPQRPPQGTTSPLLFLAPFSWSRRVSVVMQIRRCWRCWPTPILSPLPTLPSLPPVPTLTQPTGTSVRRAWCPCPQLNWRARWVKLRVPGGSTGTGQPPRGPEADAQVLPYPSSLLPSSLLGGPQGHQHLHRQSMPQSEPSVQAATGGRRLEPSQQPPHDPLEISKGTWALRGHSPTCQEFPWSQHGEIREGQE